MLKALVQLFAESFLKSKKKWLSERSVKLAYPETVFEIPKTNTWTSFTMPFDGWAVVNGSDNITAAIDCYVFDGEHQLRRLTATSLMGNTNCSVFASVVSPIALQQFLFRAKKAKTSALPFTQTVRTFPLEHLKHFRLANLQTGGALC